MNCNFVIYRKKQKLREDKWLAQVTLPEFKYKSSPRG